MSRYSIWVLEYAAVGAMTESVLLYGGDTRKTRRMPYSFAVIKGEGEVAMVDAGYDSRTYGQQLADQFGVSSYRDPEAMLAECGVSAEQVTRIFITHAHFDHVGALGRFPNATCFIQRRELEGWTRALALGPETSFLVGAVDPADIVGLAERAAAGRVVLVDGDREDVLPGIDLRLAADTHTFGSMYLSIQNGDRRSVDDILILSSDVVFVYENMGGIDAKERRYVPIGYASGSQENLLLATDAMLRAVGGDARRIVPFHETRVADNFPSRTTESGLRIVEIALASPEASRVA